jgi:hypothetical protein
VMDVNILGVCAVLPRVRAAHAQGRRTAASSTSPRRAAEGRAALPALHLEQGRGDRHDARPRARARRRRHHRERARPGFTLSENVAKDPAMCRPASARAARAPSSATKRPRTWSAR